jgi:hypothetical protein
MKRFGPNFRLSFDEILVCKQSGCKQSGHNMDGVSASPVWLTLENSKRICKTAIKHR